VGFQQRLVIQVVVQLPKRSAELRQIKVAHVIIVPRLLFNGLCDGLKLLRKFHLLLALLVGLALFLSLSLLDAQESLHPVLQLRLGMVVSDKLRRKADAGLDARSLGLFLLLLAFLLVRSPALLGVAQAGRAYVEFVGAFELLLLSLGQARALLLVLLFYLAGWEWAPSCGRRP
jgi:hypothetical protein